MLNRLGVPLKEGFSSILLDPSSAWERRVCGRVCLRRLLSRLIASYHTSVMMHTATKVGLTSYRSEALGRKALLLMLRVCLICIEFPEVVRHQSWIHR